MKHASLLVALAIGVVAAGCKKSTPEAQAPALARVDRGALTEMMQGIEYSRQKDGIDRSIDLFRRAVGKDPHFWEARYNLGVLLADRGELAEAERQLTEASRLAPNAEDVAVALGEVQRRHGDSKGAAAGLGRFVQANPEAVQARVALVSALRESGELGRAIEQARAVLVRRANDPNALSELALAHLERGEVDTAELLSAESLKAEPKTAVAERTAGLIALKRGDDAVAFRHFSRASELNPRDTLARLSMAMVLLRAGVYDRAAQEFRAVISTSPDDESAVLGLAAALRGQGSREKRDSYLEAEKLLKELREKRPKQLAATFNLAVLYADFLGKPAEAKSLFDEFLREAPEGHPARPVAQKWLGQQKGAPPQKAAPSPAKGVK